ncbi:unnamed protein product [Clavelina lepadiformis]|uniref:Uncharacterized protein n=1 Tax=Clavelina lepadiformis TaxID=159417 RepID=A0ABP0F285_CLALP
MKSITAKVLVIGAQGVGKSSLTFRLAQKAFNDRVTPTIGASYYETIVEIGDHAIKLQLWDTAGQERFKAMIPMYYRNSSAVLLVYDVTDLDSFAEAKKWEEELRRYDNKKLVIYVVGNKYDIPPNLREVDQKVADSFASEIGGHFREVSALSNHGIDEMTTDLCIKLIHRYQNISIRHNETTKKDLVFDQVDLKRPTIGQNHSCCTL